MRSTHRSGAETPGSPSPLPHRTVWATALGVGALGNLVVQGTDAPGLGMVLFFVALAVAVGITGRAARRTPFSPEALAWLLGGVLLSTAFLFRASGPLQFLAFVAAAGAFAFPALRAGAAWLRGSGMSDVIEAVAGAIGHAGLGAVRTAARALSAHTDASNGARVATAPTTLTAVVRGLLLGAPLLLVFGALFVGADEVFEGIVAGLVGPAIEDWGPHLILTAVLTWLAAGYLTGFLTGTRVRHTLVVILAGRIRRPSIGAVEAAIALGLVALLFTAFVAVQFRYLFGGAGLVEVTPGLTYAEYAREGFGRLTLASALVLPTLLVTDWLLGSPGRGGRTVFLFLGGLQLILLVLVIASAFQRVIVYTQAYGFTESRLYGVVFLGWLTLLGFWFAASVLRGRRERFAAPALLSGVAVVVGLLFANPDAVIVRANLSHAGIALDAGAAGLPVGPGFDAAYLASLSADAVPTLLGVLPRLPHDSRCIVARALLDRWESAAELDWRSWNVPRVRAHRRVRADAEALRRLSAPASGCLTEEAIG